MIEKSQFAEIIAFAQMFVEGVVHVDITLTVFDEEHAIALVTLLDDDVVLVELDWNEGIGDVRSFVVGQRLQNDEIAQEFLVQLPLAKGVLENELAESLPSHCPQDAVGAGNDRCRARLIVHECELAEGTGLVVFADFHRREEIWVLRDEDVVDAAIDDIEMVAIVA